MTFDPTFRDAVMGALSTNKQASPTGPITVCSSNGWLEGIVLIGQQAAPLYFNFWTSAASYAAGTTPDYPVCLPSGSSSSPSIVAVQFEWPLRFSQLIYTVSTAINANTVPVSGQNATTSVSVLYRSNSTGVES